jgi:hypothetical protein
MIRLLVRGRNSDAEADILRRSGHGRHNSQGLMDRPLCRCSGCGVKRPLVDIIAAEHVGDEDAMELGFLQQLGQVDPVVDIGEAERLVVGMSPESRG